MKVRSPKVKYVMALYPKINAMGSTIYVPSLVLFSQSTQNHHYCLLRHSTIGRIYNAIIADVIIRAHYYEY